MTQRLKAARFSWAAPSPPRSPAGGRLRGERGAERPLAVAAPPTPRQAAASPRLVSFTPTTRI